MTVVLMALSRFTKERAFFLLGLGVALLALLIPFVVKGAWGLALGALGLGGLWALGHFRGFPIAHWGLLGFLTLGALGTLLGFKAAMLVGTVAALAAWDLDRFARRLRDAERVEGWERLWAAHAQRLLLVIGLGLLLGGIALEGRISLRLWGAILLSIFGLLGISQVLRWLHSSR